MKPKKTIIVFYVIPTCVALLASACGGNATARSIPKVSSAAEFQKATAAPATEEKAQDSSCASQAPNIVPAYVNGSPEFQVCALTTDAFGIELYIAQDEQKELSRSLAGTSAPALPKEICVFPLQVYDADYERGLAERVVWKIGTDGFPMVKCSKLSPGGQVTFKDTYYNAVYVVEASKKTLMSQCMLAKNEYSCPPFARGKFREDAAKPSSSTTTAQK